jgi:hypothetical protein
MKLGQQLLLVQVFLPMVHPSKQRRRSKPSVSSVFPELVGHLNSPLVVRYNPTTEVLGIFWQRHSRPLRKSNHFPLEPLFFARFGTVRAANVL